MAEHAHTPTPPTVVTSRRIAVATALLALSGVSAARVTKLHDVVEFHPDAELIALYERAADADRRSVALTDRYWDMSPRDPEYAGCNAAYEASGAIISADYHPAMSRAPQVPARSLTGLQAKARLLLLHLVGDDEAELAVSLANDILAWRG